MKRQVGCLVVDSETLGAMAALLNAREGMTLYLSAPHAGPVPDAQVVRGVATEVESHFVVISLGVDLDRVRTKRQPMGAAGVLAPAGA